MKNQATSTTIESFEEFFKKHNDKATHVDFTDDYKLAFFEDDKMLKELTPEQSIEYSKLDALLSDSDASDEEDLIDVPSDPTISARRYL